ncbi:MAG: trypsin-like serine protease [Phycisphaeraceae bacterium]|nr:trypsin-like serine protease [Phycisphaeraceae bacterium]
MSPFLQSVCRRRLVAVLIVIGSTAAAQAGTIRADVDDQGYLDLGNAYASVGQFYGETDSYSFWGSGVLIDSQWVLTAGHVLDGATSLTYTIGGQDYNVVQVAVHRRWNGDLSLGYDIGLALLDRPVTDITPAKRYKAQRELGEVGTYVGYGKTGTGLTGSTTFDGEKRATQNMIDHAFPSGGKADRIYMSDFDNPNSAADSRYGFNPPLAMEGLIAPGDSGGGVFIHLRGHDLLAGVNSFGAAFDGNVDSDYGDVEGFIRVYVFNQWINNVIGSDDLDARDDVFSLTAGTPSSGSPLRAIIPEPAGLSLLVLAGVMLLRRRAVV